MLARAGTRVCVGRAVPSRRAVCEGGQDNHMFMTHCHLDIVLRFFIARLLRHIPCICCRTLFTIQFSSFHRSSAPYHRAGHALLTLISTIPPGKDGTFPALPPLLTFDHPHVHVHTPKPSIHPLPHHITEATHTLHFLAPNTHLPHPCGRPSPSPPPSKHNTLSKQVRYLHIPHTLPSPPWSLPTALTPMRKVILRLTSPRTIPYLASTTPTPNT